MSLSGRRQNRILLILICCSAVLCTVSCGRLTSADNFMSALERIDSRILDGSTDKALADLVRMRKNASSAGQWLSLVKRERSLHAYEQSIETLRAALQQLPANETIAAVMCDSLLYLDRFSDALEYASPLVRSPYSAVAARAGVEILVHYGLDAVPDPVYLTTAYRISSKSDFIKYAAVLHARRGEYVQACDVLLRTESSRYRYLTALLCFDAGFHEKVYSLYQSLHTEQRIMPAELALVADSCYKTGMVEEARSYWEQMIREHPEYSPVPYFNRAISGNDPDENLHDVISCLALFPTYLPALSLYSHAVRHAPEGVPDDPVTQNLAEHGLVSTLMEERKQKPGLDAELANDFVSRALSDPSGRNDPRLHIERIRLLPYRSPVYQERMDAQIWNLLEQFPDSDTAYDYALWYFFSSGSYDTAFSLNKARPGGAAPLYEAFEAALQGKTEAATKYFMEMANDSASAWLGLANAAVVHDRAGERMQSIDELVIAASMAPDSKIESSIQYRIAVILDSIRSYDRAESVLGYALELDPDNHRARSLLKRIQARQ